MRPGTSDLGLGTRNPRPETLMKGTLKAYLSPRRLRRLGWPGARMLAEVIRAYRLYEDLEEEPLPEMLEKMTSAKPRPPRDPADLVRVVDWYLHPRYGRDRCMPRTVILLRMLDRRGFDAEAVFGASKKESDLDSHAWIELEGEPLAEHEDPRTNYTETYRFSG